MGEERGGSVQCIMGNVPWPSVQYIVGNPPWHQVGLWLQEIPSPFSPAPSCCLLPRELVPGPP